MPSKGRTCPKPSITLKGAHPQTEVIAAGSILTRFRGRAIPPATVHPANSFNPNTRKWAKLLHDNIPGLDGLAWRPRLGGQDIAYVFFGDRCGAADFSVVHGPTALNTPAEYGRIKAVADGASITINYTK